MLNRRSWKRRDMLKGAAVAAAGAVGFPYLISSSALGNVDQLPPSERIGVAFIGPGGRGGWLVKELSRLDGVAPLAVCDVRLAIREKIRAAIEEALASRKAGGTYRACRTYIDFRDVLARDDIDAVVISAPEHWRPIMCVMAAKAGKDIFAEKPFALSIKEGQAMVEAVRRYGRVFQHGTQRRSTNEQRLRDSWELVRSGRIGKPTHAVVSVGPGPDPDFPDYSQKAPLPDRETFDWDMWLGPAPWRPYPGREIRGWQQWRDFGLRAIGNWGSHVLDMAQWVLDKDAEGPVEILPPVGEMPLVLKYADGTAIHCPRTPNESQLCLVHGTDGCKHIFGGSKIVEKYDDTPLGPGDVRLYRPASGAGWGRNPDTKDHFDNWLECIRTRKSNEEVGYRSGSLCLLIAIADRLQRPLKYDPVNGEFPGDEEANRLLDTPKRAPWKIY
ncbi:MAG: Gfo/Idh/MocA family oxidoreductase [Thermoguttaceae bacterium]